MLILFHFSAGQPYCCVKYVSLRYGEEVHNISFNHSITDIKSNERYLQIAVYVCSVFTFCENCSLRILAEHFFQQCLTQISNKELINIVLFCESAHRK